VYAVLNFWKSWIAVANPAEGMVEVLVFLDLRWWTFDGPFSFQKKQTGCLRIKD
jgi:hypothetical protein